MTQTHATPPYTLSPEEKVVQVMAYSLTSMCWGEVVVRQMVRVSTWLRTNTAPERLTLYNARVLNVISGVQSKPLAFPEMNISASQILAFHLLPPAKDPLDYDSTEPNRKMDPVSLLVGSFRVDGSLRLPSQSSMARYLDVTHENFTGVYDAKITNTLLPGLRVIETPFLLVRQETAIFTHA